MKTDNQLNSSVQWHIMQLDKEVNTFYSARWVVKIFLPRYESRLEDFFYRNWNKYLEETGSTCDTRNRLFQDFINLHFSEALSMMIVDRSYSDILEKISTWPIHFDEIKEMITKDRQKPFEDHMNIYKKL